MKRWLILLTTLLSLAAWAQRGTSWKGELADRYEVLYISNGFVSVGLAPELGGRLVSLKYPARGAELLHVDLPAGPLSLDTYVPPNRWFNNAFTNPGGLLIVPRPEVSSYDHLLGDRQARILTDPIRLQSEYSHGGLRQITTWTLPRGTATLRATVEIHNESDQWQQVGAKALGFWNPFPGEEPLQRPPVHLRGLGLVRIDKTNARIHLFRYDQGDYSGWSMGPARAGIRRFLRSKLRELAPGESTTYTFEQHFYQGLSAIDLDDEATLLQLTTDRAVYRPGEPIRIQAGAARPEPGRAFTVQLELAGQSHDLTFRCPRPGTAEWLTWTLPNGLEDGTYTLTLSGFGYRISREILIDGKTLDTIAEALDTADRLSQDLAGRGTLAKRTEAAMARARLRVLKTRLDSREISDTEALREALAEAQQLVADLRSWLGETR